MKERNGAKKLVYCSFFTALIAAGAFIKIVIPLQPVPMHITFQFFFVLIAGFLLGAKNGFFSVLIYLALGLLGIPVFASGGGLGYVLKPTFGFLIGFLFSAYTAGKLSSLLKKRGFVRLFLCAASSMLVMYFCGVVYFYFMSNYFLGVTVPWSVVLVNCFLVTLPADTLLCALSAFFTLRVEKIIKLS